MTIALEAKTRLGFVNGSILMLDEAHETYPLWKRIDNMLTTWLLNSISKEIVDSFLFANTKHELWEELKDRFGEKVMDLYCTGYKEKLVLIHREINL